MAGGKYYSKRSKDAQQDRKIITLQKKVRKMKPEVRYITSNYGTPGTGTAIVQTSPHFILLNGMQIGSNHGQRQGVKVHNAFLEFRANLEYSTGNSQETICRVIIYIDKNPRGVQRRLMGSSTPYVDSIYEYADRDPSQYKVLFDKNYLVSANNDTKQAQVICKKKLDFTSDFSRGNVGDITDFEKGAIYAMVFTNNTTAGGVLIWAHWNIKYTDN